MLLLVHNEVLCAEVASKVQAELREASDSPLETMLEPEIRAPVHAAIPAMEPSITVRALAPVSGASAGMVVEVVVMTVDAFVDGSVGTFCSAVVDEGHVCFGYQPELSLHGQHACADVEGELLVLFECALAPAAATPGFSVPIIIFHDQSYQLVGSGGSIAPTYPKGCTKKMAPLPIVRNPGVVRDVAMPFSRVLFGSDELTKSQGRQSYYPLLVEDGKGRPARMVDVGRGSVRRACTSAFLLAETLTTGDLARYRDQEADQQSNLYAEHILKELVRIRTLIVETSGDTAEWAKHVALLVPGSPNQVVAQLLNAVHVCASDAVPPHVQDIKDALPQLGGFAGYGSTGLYFGAAENFAGLERPFVITTGMQHPEYLIHRKDNEGWREGGIVDSRMYLAVTRCTLELSVVEVEVEKFAAHFQISNVASDSASGSSGGRAATTAKVATFYGRTAFTNQASHAVVEPNLADGDGLRYIRVCVDIDLREPPTIHELETAGVLRFTTIITRRGWGVTTFQWSHCKSGVIELTLSQCFAGILDAKILLEEMLTPEDLPVLSNLNLAYNLLMELPASFGQLVALTELTLNHNQLTELPAPFGQLVALTGLGVDNHVARNSRATLQALASNGTLLHVPSG